MNSQQSQYTPLESLLFFQALRAHSVTSIDFDGISAELKRLPSVRDDATYNDERLTADALRHLYLGLVKEEARRDLEVTETPRATRNGSLSPRSRKRKAPSPSLPTVEDAAKHAHLLPQLLQRLYLRYRESVFVQIRADERRHDTLGREVGEIERGEWDERFQRQQAPQSNGAIAAQLEGTQKPPVQTDGRPRPVSDQERTPAVGDRQAALRAQVDNILNPEPSITNGHITPDHRKASSTTVLPPLSEMTPQHSPAPSRPTSQNGQISHLPPPLPPGPVYQGSPHMPHPMPHQSPRRQQYARPAIAQAPLAGPGLPDVMAGNSPSSPRPMLPVPTGMQLPPGSPVLKNGASAHRGPPVAPHQFPSPTQRMSQMPLPAHAQIEYQPPHVPLPPGHGQQPYVQQLGRQQPNLQQQQPYPMARPSHQGGIQLPPFQVAAQEPNKAHQQQLAQQAAAQQGRPPHTPHAYRQPAPPQYASQTPYQTPKPVLLPMQDRDRELASSRKTPSTNPPTWKPLMAKGPPQRSPSPPTHEALSPVRKHVLPAPVLREEKPTTRRSKRHTSPEVVVQTGPRQPLEPPPRREPVGKKQARRTRATSVASSAIASSTRGRTRSQSVVSHGGDHTTHAEMPTSSRRVENGPATLADEVADDSSIITSTPGPGRVTRHRSGTMLSQVLSTGKRKRQPSPSATDEADEPTDSGTPYAPSHKDIILASKNFNRMSAVIMNDITTHRHAGPFQKPVREKDVEGYQEIVKRPQDLKSIKAAIAAGIRAVNTASARDNTTDSPAGTPNAGGARDGSMLVLEKTADLMPPKAIVNSSQLEQEVMRMFANAVMFTPGEEGIVLDARQMAEDIEGKVRDWRGAERQPEAREEEDETVGSAKRRKL